VSFTLIFQEALRFHPVSIHIYRSADEDDVLPLDTPITTADGEILTELPIPKGTRVILALPSYNRNKKLFGEDAHTFNPYRWLEPDHVKKEATTLGPFANL
jgi:cytochrome P450